MTHDEIIRQAAGKQFAQIYCLHGEEPFFIDQIEAAIEAYALGEAEKSFNQTIVYGKESDAVTLLDTLRRFPMMAERQVVFLREAQEMRGLTELAGYVEKPMPTTVFVISHKHKKLDMRTKLGKALQGKHVVVFESKKLYDNQVADWVIGYCKQHKLQIEPAAAALLAEYLGTELGKAANEIDKLAINLPKGVAISPQHIQEYVGISKEYNIFELQKALATRDLPKLARIQQYFVENIKKNPLTVVISGLYGYFSKIYMLHYLKGSSDAELVKSLELRSEWFLKEYKQAANQFSLNKTTEILGLLKVFDLRSKGVDTDVSAVGEDELLRELLWQIVYS